MTAPAWQRWAPPLDPPTPGGLPYAEAEAIARLWWADDPHRCAAIQWEHYAALLPITPTVSQIATGAQSVSYSPAMPGGAYGLALQRAAWHRSFLSNLHSVPLALG
jgi:hypothetical protein